MSSDTVDPATPLQGPLANAKCLGCGYALRGLDVPQCPECGRAFDPADPATMSLPEQALGAQAARGALYGLGATLAIKALNIVQLVVLSWLLGSKDYGYVGLAYAVATFANLITQAGVRETLIQRHREFDRLAGPSFWLSLTLGVASTAALAAAAPVAAHFFHDDRLTGLILVLATQNVFQSLCTVPDAKIFNDMRFRLNAGIAMVQAVATVILTILFASPLFNLGAYAFILPWPLTAILRMTLYWFIVPVKVGRPSVALWSELAGANTVLLAASFFYTITWHCDYMILGRLYPKDVVGRYFWAFNLSTQTLQMVSQNASGVLFPSLARLNDEPDRQRRAFLRAGKFLMAAATVTCMLQATLADPFVHLFFKREWWPAIPIVQVLSIGWLLGSLSFPASGLIKAQGRFALYLGYTITSAALFLALVYVGARAGAGLGAAIGVGVYASVTGPAIVYLAVAPIGGRARDVFSVFASPVLCGLPSFALGWGLSELLPAMPQRDIARAIVTLIVSLGTYVPLLRHFAPDVWAEFVDKRKMLTAPLQRLVSRRPAQSPA